MVDPFVLAHLSNGLTIGEAEYYVAWDCEANVAVIVAQVGFTDDGAPMPLLDLTQEDGTRLEFRTELMAHAFLLELRKENTDDAD